MAESEGRKRKRTYGTFECNYPGCTRIFKRQDHLSRHKKNHDPSSRFECTWPGCSQSFARNDIKEKHYKRHLLKSRPFADTGPVPAQVAEANNDRSDSQINPLNSSNPALNIINQYSPYSGAIITENSFNDSFTRSQASNLSPSLPNSFSIKSNAVNFATTPMPIFNNQTPVISSPGIPSNNRTISPSDLIDWLFHEDSSAPKDSPEVNFSNVPQNNFWDLYSDVSPMSLLDSMFATSPGFPDSGSRKTVNTTLRSSMVSLIPSLSMNPDFAIHHIERYLEIYWQLFHPQYPVLHKASFSNHEAHPLLLLTMVVVGASMAGCTGRQEPFSEPRKLAEEIAEPIRWLIFAHQDCKPPAKTWVIQSLLLLDAYEITNSTRAFHERAYLHHGTKIQLLRRSPFLAGDPLKDENEHEIYHSPKHVWQKWIDAESMKRATLMAFYLDAVNATVYGHMIVLYAHQIKISLPCEDELWEFDNTKEMTEAFSNVKPPKFLGTLKKLLHRQKVKTNAFSKKILLAGLFTIMFQMQQKDLQMSFLEWDQVQKFWTETISLAIDVWKFDVCGNDCTRSDSFLGFVDNHEMLPKYLDFKDTRCKYDIYYISQICMRIPHYDYMIFAGSPRRMNVSTKTSEYSVVEKRVRAWASSETGRITAIYAYMFLFEMFLSPHDEDVNLAYDPNSDPLLHRKNIMATVILVVFAYNFSLYGPESDFFESSFYQGDIQPAKEDGYHYLKRIRKAITKFVGSKNLPNNAKNSNDMHNSIKLCAKALVTIDDKNHMVGLLQILFNSYRQSEWEIGREYSRLFKNCIERLWGRQKITCDDMFTSTS